MMTTWALVPLAAACLAQPDIGKGKVKEGVAKALALVNKAAVGHAENRECFSCHQQSLPLAAFAAVKKAGFPVDQGWITRQAGHTVAFVEKNRGQYLSGKGTGGQVDTAGNILLGLASATHPADANTDAIVEYLLKRQAADGHWNASSNRPPSEASAVTTTWLAASGLKSFGAKREKETGQAIGKALEWLRGVKPKDTEDRAFRLMGLRTCGGSADEIMKAKQDLAATQHPDGGWSQTETMASDAYATATALAALEWPAADKARAKAVAFLLANQKPDGSWHVASRSKPFQKYFETGYPHGKDQWISSTAAAWAVIAMAPDLAK